MRRTSCLSFVEIKKHVANQQDGVYHLIALNSSNAPDISPFSGENFSQNLVDLYPQTDRDNPNSDPNAEKFCDARYYW